ncbi:MAG: hypothetical protein LBI89_03080 [Prevotellaceae bacterium]|nr:hypothetical protein [Prevotellaceae bacterium]
MMKKTILLAACLSLLTVGLVSISCSKDHSGSIEDGNLAGTVWEYKYSQKSSVGENNSTETIKFTSGTEGAYTKTGSWKVNGYGGSSGSSGVYNDNDAFTYVYAPETLQGVYTHKSGGKTVVFSISDDFTALTANAKYTRK